jgi:uridine phosphorylase
MARVRKGVEYHIGMKKGDVGRYVILPGDPGRVPMIASCFDSAREVASNREYRTFTGKVGGTRVSCTSTGIGCPSAAIAIEELIRIGADTFIRVGTAGSLQRHVDIGDLCITTGAIREEGTTRQYVPLEFPAVADLDVTLALREAAGRLGRRHHVGISHCKDAFYTEGRGDVPLHESNRLRWDAWCRAGALSTSMESAALMVVASIRGARVGEVLAIIGRTWEDHPIVAKTGIQDAIQTAIEAIRILAQRDRAARTPPKRRRSSRRKTRRE